MGGHLRTWEEPLPGTAAATDTTAPEDRCVSDWVRCAPETSVAQLDDAVRAAGFVRDGAAIAVGRRWTRYVIGPIMDAPGPVTSAPELVSAARALRPWVTDLWVHSQDHGPASIGVRHLMLRTGVVSLAPAPRGGTWLALGALLAVDVGALFAPAAPSVRTLDGALVALGILVAHGLVLLPHTRWWARRQQARHLRQLLAALTTRADTVRSPGP